MGKLPRGLSGQEVCKALGRVGFELSRQRGSHLVMYRSDPKARVTVPDHREVRLGTLAQIVRDAGLTVDEFLALLD